MRLFVVFMGASLLLLTSCYKSETVYYDQLDVTLTKYDTEFDFSAYTYFSMPDSTILKENYLSDDEVTAFYASGGASEKSLENLKTKFESRGYTYTSDSSLADFIAVPTILMIKQSGATYYPPGWWWGYPGYGWGGYPGWGYPGYPWNPGYVSYYSYKEGTIVLEMIDNESLSTTEDQEFLIRWMASIDGYISSDADYNQERALRGLEEAFEQSPYLKK